MEIKQLKDVNLSENIVKMDSDSELADSISQVVEQKTGSLSSAIDQKIEHLSSTIEQKTEMSVQAMLSSNAFKEAINEMLIQYGLISKNSQHVINDDGITIDINNKDTEGEEALEGVFGLEFDLDHVSIKQMTRRIDASKTNTEPNIIILDPVPDSLDLAAPGGSDLYEITFQPEEGYTLDYWNSNNWYGGECKNMKAYIKDLIENKGWPESSYNMTFTLPIKLSWTKKAFPDLDTIRITVKAVPTEDSTEDSAEG